MKYKKRERKKSMANVPLLYKYLNGKKLILVRYSLHLLVKNTKARQGKKKHNCIDIGGGEGSRFLKGPKMYIKKTAARQMSHNPSRCILTTPSPYIIFFFLLFCCRIYVFICLDLKLLVLYYI